MNAQSSVASKWAEGAVIQGPIRVLHFSDVHVQRPILSAPVVELAGKRFLAGINLMLSRGRLFQDTPQKLSALAKFAREQHITLALCTGDYTAVGTDSEHADARRHVEPIRQAALAGLVTVPGNHDLYLHDTLRHRRFEKHFGDCFSSDLPEYAVDGAYPFTRLIGSDLAVVGVNSARPNPNPFSSSGYVPPKQLEALDRVLQDPRVVGRWIIVMTHYGILRRDGQPDAKRHGLDNADELLRVCARPSVLLVHGHIHHRYHHAQAPGRPWLFCAGSATHRGLEGFWLYEVDGPTFRATPGFFDHGEYRLKEDEQVLVPPGVSY